VIRVKRACGQLLRAVGVISYAAGMILTSDPDDLRRLDPGAVLVPL